MDNKIRFYVDRPTGQLMRLPNGNAFYIRGARGGGMDVINNIHIYQPEMDGVGEGEVLYSTKQGWFPTHQSIGNPYQSVEFPNTGYEIPRRNKIKLDGTVFVNSVKSEMGRSLELYVPVDMIGEFREEQQTEEHEYYTVFNRFVVTDDFSIQLDSYREDKMEKILEDMKMELETCNSKADIRKFIDKFRYI